MNTLGAIGIFGATFLFGLIASASSHTGATDMLNPQPEQQLSTTTPSIYISPTPTPTPVKILFPQDQNLHMESLVYPGSSSTNPESNRLLLTTADNADVVTAWYQDQLSSVNLNVKSVIRNNINGNIYNQIDAQNSDMTINISITQSNTDIETTININLNYSKQT